MLTEKTAPPHDGESFGQLTVIGPAVPGQLGNYVPCMCNCGVPVFVLWSQLHSGSRTTCGTGCRPKFKKERLYSIWTNMKSRCLNPNTPSFSRYGGRGITIDPSWMAYRGFREWAMSAGYEEHLTLERVNNNGPYSPGNCKWIALTAQARNRESCITISLGTQTKILSEWAADPRCLVKYHTLYARIKKGWELLEAMTTPTGSRRSKAFDGRGSGVMP